MLVLEFMFDKSNKNWHDDDPIYNFVFLRMAEEYFNMKLENVGRVTLDEVLTFLGIDIPAGLGFYGWDHEYNEATVITFNFENQTELVSNGEQREFILLRFNINNEKEVQI